MQLTCVLWYSILSRGCIANALGIPPKPYGRSGGRPVFVSMNQSDAVKYIEAAGSLENVRKILSEIPYKSEEKMERLQMYSLIAALNEYLESQVETARSD